MNGGKVALIEGSRRQTLFVDQYYIEGFRQQQLQMLLATPPIPNINSHPKFTMPTRAQVLDTYVFEFAR